MTSDSGMKFYKYMERKYATAMLEHGEVLIGTLYEFRKTEKHGSAIGDTGEGQSYGKLMVDSHGFNYTSFPQEARSLFTDPQSNVCFRNITLAQTVNSPDMYLFCCSTAADKDAMSKMGYDSCIEIYNPRAFFNEISLSLGKKSKGFLGIAKCMYQTRYHHLFDNPKIPRSLIKPEEYRYQNEARAAWQPNADEISPILIKNKKIKKHCRMLHF